MSHRNRRKLEEESRVKAPVYSIVSNDHKTVICRIFLQFRTLKWKVDDILTFLKNADLAVSKASVYEWLGRLDETNTYTPLVKESGRLSALNEHEKDLLVGWVLEQNFQGNPVSRDDGVIFIKDKFNVGITARTVGNYFSHAHLSHTQMLFKSGGIAKTTSELAEMYRVYINKGRQDNLFKGLLCHSDVTYTSHRNYKPKTHGPKGGKAVPATAGLSPYTNAIYTTVWSDGVNRTPAVVFTHNPGFNVNSTNQAVIRNLHKHMNTYGIDPSRIFYVKADKKFVGEKPNHLKKLIQLYKDELGKANMIFSDGGNGYKEKDVDSKRGDKAKSIFTKSGLPHCVFESAIHQWCSVNDCHLHGRAKSIWRAKNPNFEVDVQETLFLMYILDQTPAENIIKDFRRNLFMDVPQPTEEDFLAHISDRHPAKSIYHHMCLHLYRTEMLGEVQRVKRSSSGLKHGLDGIRW